MLMRLGALFSGGKDSLLSLHRARSDGHEVAVLISIVSSNPESYMFHVPNIVLTEMQAKAMELPIIIQKTEGVKEEELEDLKTALKAAMDQYQIEGIVSGAIYSNYQRSRIDKLAGELGLQSLSPLWKARPRDMLTEMIGEGFEVIISAVAAGGLGPEWLGRKFDLETIDELCELHNTCYVCTGGEGGEFETLVLDAPFFKKKLVVKKSEKKWDGQAGTFEVLKTDLVPK
ncbi:MAG: diphthine--ammonia ligase [Thermoplasmata archaeon]|nr:MAG: diphthine--ammonia ligase [Thermoplasmata archaeon]